MKAYALRTTIIKLLAICVGIASFQHHLHADATQKPGLSPIDYFDFVFLSETDISPNNQDTLFVKTTVNDDASGRNDRIYKMDKTGNVIAFTQGDSDSSPKWSPDGKRMATHSCSP